MRQLKTVFTNGAAKALGIKKERVIDLIETGVLPAIRLGGRQRRYYKILVSDLPKAFNTMNRP